jgi:hypothetical protein
MAALWNARSDQNNPRNTVTHPYTLDSTRKVRTQPLTAGWLNISRHFIQEQTMTHLIKGFVKKEAFCGGVLGAFWTFLYRNVHT